MLLCQMIPNYYSCFKKGCRKKKGKAKVHATLPIGNLKRDQ